MSFVSPGPSMFSEAKENKSWLIRIIKHLMFLWTVSGEFQKLRKKKMKKDKRKQTKKQNRTEKRLPTFN